MLLTFPRKKKKKSLKSIRSKYEFDKEVRHAFTFLVDLGFKEIEAAPTLVRYQKSGVEVDVYHGRQSCEIGAGVTAYGTRYSIGAIIRAIAPDVVKHFRYVSARTSETMVAGLEELSSLMQLYGREALEGNPTFFSMLDKKRKIWSEEFALDVLARQLRPQAAEAFRKKEYAKAAELYSQIKKGLSPVELKKLDLAKKRRNKEGTA